MNNQTAMKNHLFNNQCPLSTNIISKREENTLPLPLSASFFPSLPLFSFRVKDISQRNDRIENLTGELVNHRRGIERGKAYSRERHVRVIEPGARQKFKAFHAQTQSSNALIYTVVCLVSVLPVPSTPISV